MQQQQLLPLPDGLPTFGRALETLNDIVPVILKGLENGAYKASAYRDQECPSEPLDAGFAASILRFHSSRLIKTIGSDFQLEDWIEDSMPFMGMSFYYRKYHVRILKGPNGELPGCSDSDKKKRFYNQLPSLYLIGTETIKSECNVIVLWNFGANYTLEQLRLALPARGASRAENVSAYWNEAIPYSAEATAPSAPPSSNEGPGGDGMDGLIKSNETKKENEGESNVR
jgi:hypothetical protein